VSSQENVGSTFLFYVSTRLASIPKVSSGLGSQIRPKFSRIESLEDQMRTAHLNVLLVEDNLVNQKVLSKQLQKAGCIVSVAGNGVEALEFLTASVYWRGGSKKRDTPNEADTCTAPPPELNLIHDLDIVLMDIEMPVMDGLTCARLIRNQEQQGLLGPPSPTPLLSPQISSSPLSPIASFSEPNDMTTKKPRKVSTRLPILAVSANARSEQVEEALAAGMDDAIAKPFRIQELWPKMAGLVDRCKTEIKWFL
jgi:CheY-like chemotaxis protein